MSKPEPADRRIAILIAEGFHDHEFWFPYYRFLEAGADVVVAGPATGTVYGEGLHGRDGLPAQVTHTVEQAAGMKLHCLYLPEQFRLLIPALAGDAGSPSA